MDLCVQMSGDHDVERRSCHNLFSQELIILDFDVKVKVEIINPAKHHEAEKSPCLDGSLVRAS